MNYKEILQSHSPAETEAVGEALATQIVGGKLPPFVALYGDLGVGKTAFVRGFVRLISPEAVVRSPTFALVNEYKKGTLPVFHFDMYRIEDEDDLYSIGFDDYLEKKGVCLVEWSENIPFALPSHYVRVEILKDDVTNTESRKIKLEEIKLC